MGTTFCRLCGRTYVEAEDQSAPAALALLGAGPVAQVEPAPAFSLPPLDASPRVPGPSAEVRPMEMAPVPTTGGVQVHLPLVPAQAEPVGEKAVPALEPVAAVAEPEPEPEPEPVPVPTLAPPAPTPTTTAPVDLGGPTLEAPLLEDEPELEAEQEHHHHARAVDRTVLLVGALGGFLGGAVSGAAVAVLLT